MADVLGESIIHIKDHPGSSLGAAFVAGIGADQFESWNDISKFVEIEGRTTPIEKNVDKYEKIYNVYRNLYNDLYERFDEISGINS